MGDGASRLEEIVCFCDDRQKTWQFINFALKQTCQSFIKLSCNTNIHTSWKRIAKSPFFIIHWESQRQAQELLLEQMIETDPSYPLSEHIIIVTNAPTREDIIYFGELQLKHIIQLPEDNKPMRDKALKQIEKIITRAPIKSATSELARLRAELKADAHEIDEQKRLLYESRLENLFQDDRKSPRYFDLKGWIAYFAGNDLQAEMYWQKALELNSSFHSSTQGLVELAERQGDFKKALSLLTNWYRTNSQGTRRLVKIARLYKLMGEDDKAEKFYDLALSRDRRCSSALNGLAQIRFEQGLLSESRDLMERSQSAQELASYLNKIGIALVKEKKFHEALDHYSKAQFVLTHHDKGAQLLYNIALCYLRWGKMNMATKFCRLSLTKDPNYEKAKKLKAKLEPPLQGAS